MAIFTKTLQVSALAVLTFVAACDKQESSNSTTVSSVTTEQTTTSQQQTTNSVANNAVATITAAMDTQATFDRVVERVTPLFESQTLSGGSVNKEQSAKLLEEFKATYPAVVENQKNILQQTFSEQELTQISQFLSTDIGKKFIQNSAKIQEQTEEFALQQSNTIINANAKVTNPDASETTFGSIKNSIGETATEAAKKASEAADSLKDAAKDLQLQLQGNDAKPAETQQK
jgi:hypothetical protein